MRPFQIRHFLACMVCAGMSLPSSAQQLGMQSDPTVLAKAVLGDVTGTAVVGILRDGKTTYGMARKDAPGAPPALGTEQPLFEIGSISKVFTGLLLAQAVERGELSLDDNLGKLLGTKMKLAAPVAAVTLRQLITHTSCLPRLPADFSSGAMSADNPYVSYDRNRMWTALSALALPSAPPCEAVYSNWAVGVVGELLSERYNKPWETLVRERITAPLGMYDTVQHLGERSARLLPGYAGAKRAAPWDMQAFAGAGSLRSTAADMLKFSAAVMAGKEGPLGAAAGRLVVPLESFIGNEIGYAIVIRGAGGDRTYSHSGGTGGFRSYWMLDPGRREAAIVMVSNVQAPITTVELAFRASRYPVSGTATQIDADSLRLYAGLYRVNNGLAFSFVPQDGQLYSRVTGQFFGSTTPTGPDTFAIPTVSAEYKFVREEGKIVAVTLSQGGGALVGKRTAETVPVRAVLPESELDAYVGRFTQFAAGGPQLAFDVRKNLGMLAVKLNEQERFPVVPLEGQADRFAYDVVKAELQFERDASGKVTALVLHQNGVHRVPREASVAAASAGNGKNEDK